ncbi:MAG: tetratricopeptide repeat protein [Deltaproteobacteria bacterium]|nr:tetratricopeptide repeat protein [Deltaproteobacteria bacterium]
MKLLPAVCLVVVAASLPAGAAATQPDPGRAARLAEAERAIVDERYDDAQEILDELAAGLEVEEPVLAARLELALRRAGLREASEPAAAVPPDVTAAATALERRGDPGHRSCVLLADEAIAAGNKDAAAAWLERAVVLVPEDDASRLRLALLQMERGRPDETATLALDLLHRRPRCPGILQLAGQALLAAGRPSDSVPVLERLVELAPDHAEARSLYGTALLVERRMGEAVEQLERAVELEPTPERRANLGLALVYADRTAEALALLEQLTRDEPEHGGGWINYALALAASGHLPEARSALLRALELDPDDERALVNLRDLDALMPKPEE